MKFSYHVILICSLMFLSINISSAQDKPLTKAYQEEVIQELSRLMKDYYVFPEVAEETAESLTAQFNSGHFDQFENNAAFANALTAAVQAVNHDKHMRIVVQEPFQAPANSPERKVEEQLNQLNRFRSFNAGFNNVKILEGNVGYLDLRGFAGLESGKPMADAYMKLMANADAVIIDLSKNGGGSPDMVQYLCSYFFKEKLHLNSLYYREGDVTQEFWTLDVVDGDKMPDVPLFVITSNNTFSGAEEFSYNMQTQKRAVLVGQISGGGANPGGTMRLNENLSVFIPTGKAINPITLTNWEGTGVIPEIETSIDETFDSAHQLAMVAAEDFRMKKKLSYTQMILDLNQQLENYIEGKSDDNILQLLSECRKVRMLQEWHINALGYEYLMDHKMPHVAESIFKANTILSPQSANAYDSYAEALMTNGKMDAALKNYQIAVDMAIENNDGDVELFKRNLESVKSKMVFEK